MSKVTLNCIHKYNTLKTKIINCLKINNFLLYFYNKIIEIYFYNFCTYLNLMLTYIIYLRREKLFNSNHYEVIFSGNLICVILIHSSHMLLCLILI